MTREILFRGKRIDNGEWIEGYYSEYSDYRGNKFYQIRSPVGMHNDIIPETISQYTGKEDMNGNKIFEGDFVNMVAEPLYSDDSCISEVIFADNLQWQIRNKGDRDSNFGLPLAWGGWLSIEIIGNIHDNPELITPKSESL